MDLIQLKIPWQFIRERCSLGWRQLKYGLDNELIDSAVTVERAIDLLGEQADTDPGVIELAALRPGQCGQSILAELADAEPPLDVAEVQDTWLYLVLAWVYEHRSEFSDPLQTVEMVYADFGCPQSIEGFVRYMPSEGPNVGRLENEKRLMERWRLFVLRQSKRLMTARPRGDRG